MASIVGGESDGSYNLLNGGKRFSGYSDHPYASTNKNTGYGVAAGKYQFMPGTWNDYKRKLKLPDFSPESQEIAALALARDRYRAKTGGNLDRDLEAGKVMQAAKALSPTWTSLPGGAERNKHTASFLDRFQRNLGAPMQLADNSQYGGAMTDTKPRDEDFSDIFGEWQPSNRFAAPKSEQKQNVPDSEVADIFGQSWQPSARYAAQNPAAPTAEMSAMTPEQLIAAYPAITGDVPSMPGTPEEAARARLFELQKAPPARNRPRSPHRRRAASGWG